MNNGYAGIGSACDWLGDNYIYSNVIANAKGPGIGVNSPAHIYRNFSILNKNAPECSTPYDYHGCGIGFLANAAGVCIKENTCVGNEHADIYNPFNVTHNKSDNVCYTAINSSPCDYNAGVSWIKTRADADKSGKVTYPDFDILSWWWNKNCCSLPR